MRKTRFFPLFYANNNNWQVGCASVCMFFHFVFVCSEATAEIKTNETTMGKTRIRLFRDVSVNENDLDIRFCKVVLSPCFFFVQLLAILA